MRADGSGFVRFGQVLGLNDTRQGPPGKGVNAAVAAGGQNDLVGLKSTYVNVSRSVDFATCREIQNRCASRKPVGTRYIARINPFVENKRGIPCFAASFAAAMMELKTRAC